MPTKKAVVRKNVTVHSLRNSFVTLICGRTRGMIYGTFKSFWDTKVLIQQHIYMHLRSKDLIKI